MDTNKITVLGLIIVGVVTVGCATMYESNNTATNASANKWKKQAPQLFNNAGYIKLEESAPTLNKDQSESMYELIGSITNPFGIRDDILEHIIKIIPNNNESAMSAAIKMMQYNQLIYYGNLRESEALLVSNKEMLASDCLRMYLNQDSIFQNNNSNSTVKYTSYLRSMMVNNKDRDHYINNVDNKYFSWKVLGTGLSTYEETIACQKGEF